MLQGRGTAAGLGVPNLPMSAYPGQVTFHSAAELPQNIEAVLADQVVKGLTSPLEETKR